MYYYGYFRDTDTSTDSLGNLYKVVIITNFTKQEYEMGGELQLSSSPFITKWSGEEDNLFKGYKCSTATVGFYQENYNFEFNNTRENNVFVALLKMKRGKTKYEDVGMDTDNDVFDVVWTGYATPNAYSQSYSSSLDLFELECQDALSTLKYKRFSIDSTKINPYSSFYDILIRNIGELGNYKHIYASSSLVLPTEDLGSILEFIYINGNNFIDEDGKASSVLEVLNEICVYLGLTMIAWGDSVYFLDYHSLEHGEYYEYYSRESKSGLPEGTYPILSSKRAIWEIRETPCEFHHLKDIKKEDFAGSNTTLSLGSTYNKVTVNADHYGLDSILCDFEETTNYIYSKEFDVLDTNYGSIYVNSVSAMGTELNATYTSDGTKYCKTIYKFKELDIPTAKKGNLLEDFSTYWYNKDKAVSHYYQYAGKSWNTVVLGNGGFVDYFDEARLQNATYDDLRKYIGATFVEYVTGDVNNFNENLTGEKKTAIAMSLHHSPNLSLGEYPPTANDLASDYASGLMVFENYYNDKTDKHTYSQQDTIRQKMFSVRTQTLILGQDDYIIIKGNMTFFNANGLFIPLANADTASSKWTHFLWCSLQDEHGNYWTGKSWKDREFFAYSYLENGVETYKLKEPVFSLPLKYSKGTGFGKSVPFVSYLDSGNVVEGGGYVVSAPPSAVNGIPTRLIFTLYRPYGLCTSAVSDFALLEDFDITISGRDGNDVIDSTNNTNTSYTNNIKSGAIEEYPDVEFKITSWRNKQINLSTTYWHGISPRNLTEDPVEAGVEFWKLKQVHNKSTGQFGRPEELAVYNYSKQYSTPTASLELSLYNSLGITPYSLLQYHYLPDRTFVVDGMSIDYEYNTNNITLIEIK